MTEPLKIGIVSFAHMHAVSYADCLTRLPEATLAGIYDDDPQRGRTMAARFGTSHFEDYEGLLGQGLEGLIICSENIKHAAQVLRAAGRVKAILCEKPLATTVHDAERMIAACADGGTALQTAFPVRFSPPVQRLKELLDAGTLGRIISVTCTNHGKVPGGWFVDPELSGGGAVMDHTVHVVDLLRWFWGTEVSEVYAEVGHSLLNPGLGTDDAGILSFRLANGVYGTLDTSWSRPQSFPIWGDVTIEVLGEKGVAKVDAFSQNLSLVSDLRGKSEMVSWGSNPDMGLVRDFLETLRSGRLPSISGEDGLRALEVALAAYRSAQTRQPVVP